MKKILIVEDEEILSEVLKDRFTDDGWEVTIAMDGEEAMEKVKKESFDLMLLDLIMPKKNGFEVLEEINNNPELKDLSIIVLSNLGTDEDIKKALSLGAKDYFVKTQHPVSEIIEKAKKFQSQGANTNKLKEEPTEKTVSEEVK